jgi:hypothetical protein
LIIFIRFLAIFTVLGEDDDGSLDPGIEPEPDSLLAVGTVEPEASSTIIPALVEKQLSMGVYRQSRSRRMRVG